MKTMLRNLSLSIPDPNNNNKPLLTFSIEGFEQEYDVDELKQFAENAALIINTLKNAVMDLTPIIVSAIEDVQGNKKNGRTRR